LRDLYNNVPSPQVDWTDDDDRRLKLNHVEAAAVEQRERYTMG
jgi:hypothetical protein